MNETPDTYQDWVNRMASNRDGRPLSDGEEVAPATPKPFEPIEFTQLSTPKVKAEYCKKNGDLIFHFFPKEEKFPTDFSNILSNSFIKTFRDENRLFASYIPELDSWAVKAEGYASNPMLEDLVDRLMDELELGL